MDRTKDPLKIEAPDYSSSLLPEQYRGGLQRYIEHRIQTGGFLESVLRNDLMEACARIDDNQRVNFWNLAKWIYNNVPGCARGSHEKVQDWLRSDQPVETI